MIAFVMAIDLICCTCAGFGFLHTFGGLFLFYTLVATFNTDEDYPADLKECWTGNTPEETGQDKKNQLLYFVQSSKCIDICVPTYLYILAAICLVGFLVRTCTSTFCRFKYAKEPKGK